MPSRSARNSLLLIQNEKGEAKVMLCDMVLHELYTGVKVRVKVGVGEEVEAFSVFRSR